MKGIRLIPFNILESINNFADTYFIQKTLGFNNLALYNHAKLYVNKFSFFDKAFFQAYSVEYLECLKLRRISKKFFKIELFWYLIILFIGISSSFFAEIIIDILTHGMLNESAYYLPILFLSVFFRSNQQVFLADA